MLCSSLVLVEVVIDRVWSRFLSFGGGNMVERGGGNMVECQRGTVYVDRV